jgi:hypothetical protein
MQSRGGGLGGTGTFPLALDRGSPAIKRAKEVAA